MSMPDSKQNYRTTTRRVIEPLLMLWFAIFCAIAAAQEPPDSNGVDGEDTGMTDTTGARPILPDPEQQMRAVASSLHADEAVWLGDDPAWLGWYRAPLAADQPRATLLILLDKATALQARGTVRGLYRELPNRGWGVLAITLPDKPDAFVPPRTASSDGAVNSDPATASDDEDADSNQPAANSDNASDAKNKEAQTAFNQTLTERLGQAQRYLKEQQPDAATVVVVGNGYAAETLPLIADTSNTLGGLLLLNIKTPTIAEQQRNDVLKKLSADTLLILDVLAGRQSDSIASGSERKRLFQLAGIDANYRLMAVGTLNDDHSLARRIRGWLTDVQTAGKP